MNLDIDSRDDFKLTNGVGHVIMGEEPQLCIAREANGNQTVPTYNITRMFFNGFDKNNLPDYVFVCDDDGAETADLRMITGTISPVGSPSRAITRHRVAVAALSYVIASEDEAESPSLRMAAKLCACRASRIGRIAAATSPN